MIMLKQYCGNKVGMLVTAAVAVVLAAIGYTFSQPEAEKQKKIELKTIHSTNGQKELQQVDLAATKIGDKLRISEYGASNVFLVRGKDISEAIKETHAVVWQLAPGDKIEGVDSEAWLVVFFGVAGSGGERWKVISVDYSPKRVRVWYKENDGIDTDDIHHYYAWIPLGKLDPGTFSMELWDQNTNEMVISRRCHVTTKRK
jgi:hypothetical protein